MRTITFQIEANRNATDKAKYSCKVSGDAGKVSGDAGKVSGDAGDVPYAFVEDGHTEFLAIEKASETLNELLIEEYNGTVGVTDTPTPPVGRKNQ